MPLQTGVHDKLISKLSSHRLTFRRTTCYSLKKKVRETDLARRRNDSHLTEECIVQGSDWQDSV